jgi:hypothetical protein
VTMLEEVGIMNWRKRLLDTNKMADRGCRWGDVFHLSYSLIGYSAERPCILIQSLREHLFHGFNRDEAELLFGFFGDIDEVLFI